MSHANTLTIGIFATLAQHERELISQRTKAALDAKKAKGAMPGKARNLTLEAQRKGVAGHVRQAAENENNRRALSLIAMKHQAGRNYVQIAVELNRADFRTARGGQFQAKQGMRLINRQPSA